MLRAFGWLLLTFVLEAAVPPCAINGAASSARSLWLLCDRGQLLVSSNMGASWRVVPVPTDGMLRAVHFLDARRGLVAGDEGLLLATIDGGRNWRRIDVVTNENLTSIHFVGELDWVAGG